jgi:hypothetical protein
MAITNADLIRDSLALITVLGEGQNASAEQAAHALQVLNHLMDDWEADGVVLDYFPQTDLSDETPIPSNAIAGVKGFLAAALAPYYGKKLPIEFVAINDRFYSRLVREAVKEQVVEMDLNRPAGTGQRSGGSFEWG